MTGARNTEHFMDIDVTGKKTFVRRTKAGHTEIVVQENINPEDIIGHGKVHKNINSTE